MTTPFMLRALGELLLLAALCGPVGAFVLVRRLSFVADALTHTVFPGVVAGFLAGGAEGVFAGALVAGVLTAAGLTILTRAGGLSSDAATAVLLTGMFAAGVVLVSRRSSYASDLTAFLFGRILTVTPRQLVETAVLAVVVLGSLAAGGRQFLFRAFDPAAAAAAGFRVARLDLWLNLLVALVVVAAVRAAGTVLVVALLVVPAATARLVTGRFVPIMLIATGLIAGAGWLGLWLSWTASVDHGWRLTTASAVVLLLVAAYLMLLPLGWSARALRRARRVRSPRSALLARRAWWVRWVR
ncbi:metal ABC transporter permease [Actinoplanes sp. CA-030573]|uniref:metal ABC transporter permease n=1 Tax=Actinoplanes sp. CA-030573 TaxID=3239898 RepID=UPI003D8C1ED9